MSASEQQEEVKAELERILQSEDFAASPRLSAMLAFIVSRTLEGRTARLKAFNIAHHVFGRDENFDAATDPLVRVQASRLRKAIERYYLTAGSNDRIMISIPKGGYAARFLVNEAARSSSQARLDEAETGPTLAIQSFEANGDVQEKGFYAAGIAQELAVALCQIENLHVIELWDAEVDSPEKLRDSLREAGARFLLQGHVQQSAQTLRVTASLADTTSGELVWAETFDRDLGTGQIFEILDQICDRVTARIADDYGVIPRLLRKELRSGQNDDLGAYEAILQWHHYNSHLSADCHRQATQALEKAVQRDPDHALALAALAELCYDNMILRFAKPYDGLKEAYAYSRRAITADPECQAAWYAMAFVHFLRGEDAQCLAAANKAVELQANRPYYVGAAGQLIALAGDWARGLEILRAAIRLNPYYPTWFNLAPFQYHYFNGEYDEALSYAEKIRAPGIAWDPLARMAALAKTGQNKRAADAYEELLKDHPDFDSYARRYIGYLVFDAGNADLLYKAYLEACELASA